MNICILRLYNILSHLAQAGLGGKHHILFGIFVIYEESLISLICRMATNEVEAAHLASLSYEINKNGKGREDSLMALQPYIDTESKIVSSAR